MSPADRGRDIEAVLPVTDLDDARRLERWFVEAKHHKKGVGPDKLQSVLTWAWAERPDVVLIVASHSLSNGAKDYLRRYEENIRPPFRIKQWERPQLKRYVEGDDQFLRNALQEASRTEAEILAAEQEFFDKIWYGRHLIRKQKIEFGEREAPTGVWEIALAEASKVRKKYGQKNLPPLNDFDWGMLHGKLSALRWVLGNEWDFLDT